MGFGALISKTSRLTHRRNCMSIDSWADIRVESIAQLSGAENVECGEILGPRNQESGGVDITALSTAFSGMGKPCGQISVGIYAHKAGSNWR